MAPHNDPSLDQKLRDLSVMYELMSSIGTSLDMHAELDRFLQKLLKRFGYDIGAVLVKDSEGEVYTVSAASGFLKNHDVLGMRCGADQFGISEMIASKRPLVKNRLSDKDRSLIILPEIWGKVQSFCFMPVLFQEELLGVLRLFSFSEQSFPEKSLRMLTPLVERLGKAINHISTVERLQRAEESLRREQNFTEAALNSLADIFLVFDPRSGRPVRWNKRFEKVSGYSTEEVGRLRIPEDLVAAKDLAFIRSVISQTSAQQIETIELPMISKSGELIPTEFSSSLLREEGSDCHYFITLGRDISERKRAEQEKKQLERELRQAYKMEAIGTLAGGIAHDFNNILSIMLGYGEMARHRVKMGKEVVKELDEVIKAGHRASELIRQILTYSRKGEEVREIIDLQLVIRETIRFLRASIPSTITLKEEYSTDQGYVLADATQLHQVLMNLCGNAAQAMEDQGGTLTISMGNHSLSAAEVADFPELSPGDYVKLAVSDTGGGIDPLHIERIFDPYFTTKEIGKGSGMGLAVVQGIVRSHNGAIRVESVPGRTTFSVYFPRQEPLHRMEKITEELELGRVAGERILLVDDESDLAEIGRQFLEQSGYRVTVKTDSVEALELFRADPDAFDLLITDQTMPQLTGIGLCQEVLKLRPGFATVIYTGLRTQLNQEKAAALGIRELLSKPLNYKKLGSLVRRVLDEKKL